MSGLTMRATAIGWLIVAYLAALSAGIAGWVGARFEALEWWALGALALAVIVLIAGARPVSLVASVAFAIPSTAAAVWLASQRPPSEAVFWWVSAVASTTALAIALLMAHRRRRRSRRRI